MKKLIISAIAVTLISIVQASSVKAEKWFRGNTHTHSTLSDGDVDLNTAVKWYNDHGYNFIFLTDHNLTANLNNVTTPLRADFITIQANEITSNVHLTAMGVSAELSDKSIREEYAATGKYGENVVDSKTIEGSLILLSNAIVANGAVAFANHPNFSTGIQAEEMMNAKNITHLEIFNGHPGCLNWGKEGHTSVDIKWDKILSSGKLIYGVASDDTHNYKKFGRDAANPGRGWIMVKASDLTPEALTKSIKNGDFYASNGVHLSAYHHSDNSISVEVDKDATIKEYDKGFLFANITTSGKEGFFIEVIGEGGKIIQSGTSLKSSYKLKKEDKYARIRVTYCVKKGDEYHNFYAWTQPIGRFDR